MANSPFMPGRASRIAATSEARPRRISSCTFVSSRPTATAGRPRRPRAPSATGRPGTATRRGPASRAARPPRRTSGRARRAGRVESRGTRREPREAARRENRGHGRRTGHGLHAMTGLRRRRDQAPARVRDGGRPGVGDERYGLTRLEAGEDFRDPGVLVVLVAGEARRRRGRTARRGSRSAECPRSRRPRRSRAPVARGARGRRGFRSALRRRGGGRRLVRRSRPHRTVRLATMPACSALLGAASPRGWQPASRPRPRGADSRPVADRPGRAARPDRGGRRRRDPPRERGGEAGHPAVCRAAPGRVGRRPTATGSSTDGSRTSSGSASSGRPAASIRTGRRWRPASRSSPSGVARTRGKTLEQVLMESGMSTEEATAYVRRGLALDTFTRERLAPSLRITDAEMRAYYEGPFRDEALAAGLVDGAAVRGGRGQDPRAPPRAEAERGDRALDGGATPVDADPRLPALGGRFPQCASGSARR